MFLKLERGKIETNLEIRRVDLRDVPNPGENWIRAGWLRALYLHPQLFNRASESAPYSSLISETQHHSLTPWSIRNTWQKDIQLNASTFNSILNPQFAKEKESFRQAWSQAKKIRITFRNRDKKML